MNNWTDATSWQPMQTAPAMKLVIICFSNGKVMTAVKSNEGWCFQNGDKIMGSEHITHWQELPSAPRRNI